MAFDEGLAARVRDIIGNEDGLTEKKMFGGLAMLLHGNMAVDVHGEGLIVRAEPATQDAILAEPGARVFDMTSWPMKGWLTVDPQGWAEDDDLRRWVARGVGYARILPPKGLTIHTDVAPARRRADRLVIDRPPPDVTGPPSTTPHRMTLRNRGEPAGFAKIAATPSVISCAGARS